MAVSLSKRTEEIVQARLKTGHYATPDEVVNRLIEEGLPTETSLEFPSDPSAVELKCSLLAAVSKPVSPYRKANSSS